MRKISALSSGFMLISLLGLVISVLYLYHLSKPWGFSVALICLIMLFASLISMAYSPDVEGELQLDPKRKVKFEAKKPVKKTSSKPRKK